MAKKKTCQKQEKDSFAKRHDQKIQCDVENCAFHDGEDHCCELPEIKVSCDGDPSDTTEKATTICDSFECSDECCSDNEKGD